ncbi:MAG: mercury resistance system transport protein MerF [Pseudomonadales bacterium]|nr:mercury resistance system transport protein MerF [Pseudomonadales bacterium]
MSGLAGFIKEGRCKTAPFLFGVLGLSAVIGYLDLVLLPALAFFIGLTGYAIWRKQRRTHVTNKDGG